MRGRQRCDEACFGHLLFILPVAGREVFERGSWEALVQTRAIKSCEVVRHESLRRLVRDPVPEKFRPASF
jgi:hypothetical protein